MNTILKESKLTKSQFREFRGTTPSGNNVIATVRYDDNCGNGHNSFSINGEVYSHGKWSGDRNLISCGQVQEDIATAIPYLVKYFDWCLMSSDEPMHYIANTLYHARDREYKDKKIGEAVKFNTFLKFDDIPFTFKENEKGFWKYLNGVKDFNDVSIIEVPYDGKGSYNFSPKYSLLGFDLSYPSGKWYKAPFDTKKEASEFLEALRSYGYVFVDVACKWNDSVIPNLKAARNSALWADATISQLQDKKLLEDRLPKLRIDFMNAIESLGFTY